jgi:radical SAM/Cys-rich protein
MGDEVFAASLAAIARVRPALVDLTGGSPETHPRFREFVGGLRGTGTRVRIRSNLTVLLEPGLEDLPGFLASSGVDILASLPSLERAAAEAQRGADVVPRSMEALRRLNAVGYGSGSNGLVIDIAYNPPGAALPDDQGAIERHYRRELARRFGVRFDRLLACANVPVGRFRGWLRAGGGEDAYIGTLRDAFNPATVPRLACRSTAVVAWDGSLWDCDYNLGARLPPAPGVPRRVEELDTSFARRRISFGPHCFGCAARAGSS